MNDLTIIGGGLAGLAAAAWCAREGLGVVLLERANAPGGRAQTDVILGHAFNRGGHALYVDGDAMRGLRDLGVRFTGAPPPVDGLLGIARGGLHRFPSGFLSILATDLLNFGAKIEAARVFATLVRTDPRPLRDVYWRSWLERMASLGEVRAAVDSIARVVTYTNAPGRASAGATIEQIKRGVSPGVLYLDGGWQTLVDGLARVAVAAGAKIVCEARATSVARAGTRKEVITADGQRIASDAVLVATGPATARAILDDAKLGVELVPSHAACLDLGLAELPRPERLVAFGLDRPTYFSVHSARARLAERGATVQLMKYLNPDESDDPTGNERELEAVVDLVQPGWRNRVVARRFMPNLVATNAIVAVGARRPAIDATGLEGVYVAGDWVGERAQLADAAIASSREASSRIVAEWRRSHARSASRPATMAAS